MKEKKRRVKKGEKKLMVSETLPLGQNNKAKQANNASP